jgi:DICT domain-containing protein
MLEGSILHKLRDAHQSGEAGKRALNFGVYYKNTLVALCHALEDSILSASNCTPLMITAFQRGKWYLQEAERYGEISQQAQQVVILAAPDTGFANHPTSQRGNVKLVSLEETDPVAQEWHLIIVSPTYTAMVLCQELSAEDYGPSGVPQADLARKFYGFWTFEPSLVIETAQIAIAHIRQYDPALHQSLLTQLEAIAPQAQEAHSPYALPTADHLGDVVARVVDYLHSSQSALPGNVPSLVDSPTSYQGLDSNLLSNELQAFLRVAQLMDQTDLQNPMAGAEVASLAEALGQILDLPTWQLHRLRLGGLLHRIAFLGKGTVLSSGETEGTLPATGVTAQPLTCPLVPGVQVLRKMPRLRAIATILTHQTEWWNGSGSPAGLAGDAIPLESRILGLVITFQARLATIEDTQGNGASSLESPECLLAALTQCQEEAGERWDPKLVDVLTLLVRGLSQGMSLSVALPKIAAGLWMMDSHADDEVLDLALFR